MVHSVHIPVLLEQTVQWLSPQPGQLLVDGTLGGGGHTRQLAELVGTTGRIIALDRDPAAVSAAQRELGHLPVEAIQADFRDLPDVLERMAIEHVDGVILDLGLSSDQLDDWARGFSYESDGPLDLRFDTSTGEPAWRLLERLRERDLADLIYEFGEERFSRRLARQIVARRKTDPVRTAAQLSDLARRCVPRSRGHRIHPATRTFQALRIAVNDELGALDAALRHIPDCLNPGGRLAIISFHSLEDRRVKTAFRDDTRLERLTRKPVRPTEEEIASNPRSRSARLRAARRC
jgi:16S rRNA (cytosine1402-N4)-methyltransferase